MRSESRGPKRADRCAEAPTNWSVVFLGKRGHPQCKTALDYCRRRFGSVKYCLGDWGDDYPKHLFGGSVDLVLSYLSRWILTEDDIQTAKVAALNFHPAPPKYRGFGGASFALVEGEEEFGVTCHYLDRKIDHGTIVSVDRFPIHHGDDIASLLERTHSFQLIQFFEVMEHLQKQGQLSSCSVQWPDTRRTRAEFERLLCVSPSISSEELERRVRAFCYGQYSLTTVIAGREFTLRQQLD